MKTVDHFFSSAQISPSQDRQSKIQELRKPVYSKKIKQKKHKRLFGSTQFIAFSDLKSTLAKAAKNSSSSFHRVKRSKSDLLLTHKKQSSFNQQTKMIPLGDNLIIEKLQFDKSTGKLQVKKNNFIKTLSQIIFSGNLFMKEKPSKRQSIQNCQNEENYFVRSSNDHNTKKEQKIQTNQEKFIDRKQNFKIIELIKKQQIQENIVQELNLLRKRRHSCEQQNRNVESNKKESLIRKNSLFLMNYLKQKEKQFETDKSPHINFMRNTAQNIKIQENTDLRKNILNKITEKMTMRNKAEQQKSDKINRIFNTMKIDPW